MNVDDRWIRTNLLLENVRNETDFEAIIRLLAYSFATLFIEISFLNNI